MGRPPVVNRGSDYGHIARGSHQILLRVDTSARSSDVLRLELFRVEGSSAEFTVVDGA
ncbi:MAG: hypothetical protein R3B91_10645 [Planctomycetaceae bacterium]